MAAKLTAGWRSLSRPSDGEQIRIHLAPVVRRVPPIIGVTCTMPWIQWQAFIPGQDIAFRIGHALSPEGAEKKAWKALDEYRAGRRRWQDGDETGSDNALKRDYSHDLLEPEWPRR